MNLVAAALFLAVGVVSTLAHKRFVAALEANGELPSDLEVLDEFTSRPARIWDLSRRRYGALLKRRSTASLERLRIVVIVLEIATWLLFLWLLLSVLT